MIGILGTVHSDELREKIHYPLDLLKELIIRFDPDIICGEVRPEDWSKYVQDPSYSGYFGPNEYREAIIPLCERSGITFCPIDYFEDDQIRLDHFALYPEKEQESLDSLLTDKYEKILALAKDDPIPFNSYRINELIEEKQEWLRRINPNVQEIVWDRRNKKIVEHLLKILMENKRKRVLVTIGFEHCYTLLKTLEELNYEVEFPLGTTQSF